MTNDVVEAVLRAPVEVIQTAAEVSVPPLVAFVRGFAMIVSAVAAGVAEVWPLVALAAVLLAAYAGYERWWK